MSSDAIPSVELDRHEAEVWAMLVEATAQLEGNRLHAEVDRTGVTPLPLVAVLDSPRLNRVINPEMLIGDYESELDRLCAFYSNHGQRHFAVEVPLKMATATLTSALSERGLTDHGERIARTMKLVIDTVPDKSQHPVIELGRADRDAWVAATRAAWNVPHLMNTWFASTFDLPDLRHFGIKDVDRLVAVGAMHVADGLAWLGLGATRPEQNGQGMQLALFAHRARTAAELGCTWAHSETLLKAGENTNTPLRNMLRAGFVRLSDRIVYESSGFDD